MLNRRGFLSRVGAVAAAPAIVKLTAAAGPQGESASGKHALAPLSAAADPLRDQDGAIIGPHDEVPTVSPDPRPWSVAFTEADARLQLQLRRGLVAPCPNCRRLAWRVETGDRRRFNAVQCDGCGWVEYAAQLVRPCPCDECTVRQAVRAGEYPIVAIEQWRLDEGEARAGHHYFVLDGGRPVLRTSLNLLHYEWTTDTQRYLHRAVERQRAYVRCAFHSSGSPSFRYVDEIRTSTNGDSVIYGWDLVDCDEWHKEGRPSWAPAWPA